MASERDIKLGLCSATGRPCRCDDGKGCSSRRVDRLPAEAVRWTKAAMLRLAAAETDIDLVLAELERSRPHPRPELRQVQRNINKEILRLKELLE